MNRRILFDASLSRPRCLARARTGQVDHRRLDDLDEDSGLFGHILPIFKPKTGIDVKVISQGTGQALDTGRRGDADVVFVHAKAQEEHSSPTASV